MEIESGTEQLACVLQAVTYQIGEFRKTLQEEPPARVPAPEKKSSVFASLKTFIRFRAGMRRSIARKIQMLNRTTIAELWIDHDTPVCYKIDGSPVMMNRWAKEMVNKKFSEKKTMNRIELTAVGFLIAVLTGCSSDPEPLEISNIVELDATVIAVDAEARKLVLRGPEGNAMGFRVGPEVRNLSQVEAGDTLRVSYYTGYVLSISEPGDAGSDAEVAVARAAEGERPGAMLGATMRATVEILSVAKDGKSVSFRDAEGQLQSIQVRREDAQAFARKLSKGDLVDIRYSEAIAVGVEAAETGS